MAEVIKKEEVEKILSAVPETGKRMIFKSGVMPFGILEDHMTENDAEVHVNEGDLWYCLEGEVDFICGGELVEPWFCKDKEGNENKNEQKAKSILGGKTVAIRQGDWLWVAPGEPHQHKCEKTARLVVIKVPKT